MEVDVLSDDPLFPPVLPAAKPVVIPEALPVVAPEISEQDLVSLEAMRDVGNESPWSIDPVVSEQDAVSLESMRGLRQSPWDTIRLPDDWKETQAAKQAAGERDATIEEIREANKLKDEIDPIFDLPAKDLADMAEKKENEFDLVSEMLERRPQWTPELQAKVSEAHRILNERRRIIPTGKDIVESGLELPTTVADWASATVLWAKNFTLGVFGDPTESPIVSILSGRGPVVPPSTTEKRLREQQAAGTAMAASGAAVKSFGIDLPLDAIEKILGESPSKWTPEKSAKELAGKISRNIEHKNILAGGGTDVPQFSPEVRAEMKARGLDIDPAESAKAEAGDPFSLMAIGPAFKGIGVVLKVPGAVARRATRAGLGATVPEVIQDTLTGAIKQDIGKISAKAGKIIGPAARKVDDALYTAGKFVPSVQTVVGKGIQSAGMVADTFAKWAEKVAPVAVPIAGVISGVGAGGALPALGQAVAALLGGGTSLAYGMRVVTPTLKAIRTQAQKLGYAGKSIAATTAAEIAETPIRGSAAAAIKGAAQSVPGVVEGAVHGAALDLSLAALTTLTSDNHSALQLGAALGIAGGLRSGLMRTVGEVRMGARDWGHDVAVPTSGVIRPFETMSQAAYNAAPRGVQRRVNALRQLLKGVDADADLFMADPARKEQRQVRITKFDGTTYVKWKEVNTDTEAALLALGETKETAEFYASQNGWFDANVKVPGQPGKTKRVIVVNSVDSAPHEAKHAFQNVNGELANQVLDRIVRDSFSNEMWDFLGRDYTEKLLQRRLRPDESWQDLVLQASGEGNAAAELKSKIYALEALKEKLGRLPTKAEEDALQRVSVAGGEITPATAEPLTPAERKQAADKYIAREVSAETFDAVFKHFGPAMAEKGGLISFFAKVVAATTDLLGGDSLRGRTSEVLGVPLKTDIVEGVTAQVRGRMAEVAGKKPVITPKIQVPKGISAAPPGTPEQEADKAKKVAENAPDEKTGPDQVGPDGLIIESQTAREVLGAAAEAMSQRARDPALGSMMLDYRSAPGTPAGVIEVILDRRTGRRGEVEAGRGMSADQKILWEKLFTPVKVAVTGAGEYQVQGIGQRVVGSNANEAARFLSDVNRADLSPFEIDIAAKTFTEAGWQNLFDKIAIYNGNQAAGLTGKGTPLDIGRAREFGFYEPTGDRQKVGDLTDAEMNFINYLLGYPLPGKGATVGRGGKAQYAEQLISQATEPGRAQPLVEPRTFGSKEATKLGFAGEQLLEVNPLRAQIEQAARDAKRSPPSPIEVWQNLNLKDIVRVQHTPELPSAAHVGVTARAGFSPKPTKEITERFKSSAPEVKDESGAPKIFYHGSFKMADMIESLKESGFDISKTSNVSLFGPGFYFTSDPNVAGGPYWRNKIRSWFGKEPLGYAFKATSANDFFPEPFPKFNAEAISEMGGTPGIYPAFLDLKNPLNMEKHYPNSELRPILDNILASSGAGKSYYKTIFQGYERDGWGITGQGFYRHLEDLSGSIKKGRSSASDSGKVNQWLQEAGFDGIAYVGGVRRKGTSLGKHSVMVAFKNEQIVSPYAAGAEGPVKFAPNTKSAKDLEKDGFEFKFTKDGDTTYLDVTKDGNDVGYVDARVRDNRAEVDMIQVEPEYRRQGIGEALLREMAAELQSQGITKVGGYTYLREMIENVFGEKPEILDTGEVISTIRPETKFAPMPANDMAIRAPAMKDETTGRIYEGFIHAVAQQDAESRGAKGPFTRGFVTNRKLPNNKIEFLNVDEAFDRAEKIGQLPEGQLEMPGGGLESTRFEEVRKFSPAAERKEIELIGPDGKKYRAMFDGYQDFSASGLGHIAQITPLEDLPGSKVKGSTTYGSSLEKAGYKLPADLPAPEITETGETQFSPKTDAGRKLEKEEGFRFRLTPNETGTIFRVSVGKGGKEIGSISATLDGEKAEIHMVHVDEKYRQQGIGEALYRELASELQQRGASSVGGYTAGPSLGIRERVFGSVERPEEGTTKVSSPIRPETKFAPKKAQFEDPETIREALASPGWAIITGTQERIAGKAVPWDDPRNIAANARLRAELKAKGYETLPVEGKYKGESQGESFAVMGIIPAEAQALGKKYGQESIITNQGLIYGDGSRTPAVPEKTLIGPDAEKQEFYSITPEGTAFSIGLDFDKPYKPVGEQQELFGKTESNAQDFSRRMRARIADKKERFPESAPLGYEKNTDGSFRINAKTGKPVPEKQDHNFLESGLAKESGKGLRGEAREAAYVKAAGDDMAAEYQKAVKDPEVAAGAKWYSTLRTRLRKLFGDQSQLVCEVLAATSARTPVETNYKFSLDAVNKFNAGDYDAQITKYQEGLDNWDAGNIADYVAATGRDNPKRATFLDWWINTHDLKPRQSNGKLFAANSKAVLRALHGSWEGGKKTRQFSQNMSGADFGATVDVWAARTLHRISNENRVARWRILAEHENAVQDADFDVAQKVFKHAADKAGIKPDAMQGVLWFREKDLWEKRGWTRGTGAEKSDFSSLIAETERAPSGQYKMKSPQGELKFSPKKKLGECVGNCVDEVLVEDIFGSVSEFARQVEEHGNEFVFENVQVSYDPKKDIHTFWKLPKEIDVSPRPAKFSPMKQQGEWTEGRDAREGDDGVFYEFIMPGDSLPVGSIQEDVSGTWTALFKAGRKPETQVFDTEQNARDWIESQTGEIDVQAQPKKKTGDSEGSAPRKRDDDDEIMVQPRPTKR